jgi:hypothetical protein
MTESRRRKDSSKSMLVPAAKGFRKYATEAYFIANILDSGAWSIYH